MQTRFPLLGFRHWLVPAMALLILSTPSLAARPEIKASGQRVVKSPSYLAQHGLAPAEAPGLPVAEPTIAARAAMERLRSSGEGRWSVDWDATKGTPITVYGGRVGPYQGTPLAAARAFLRDYADLFNLSQGAALKHEKVSTSRGGTRVLFVQRHRGLTVNRGGITVLVDGDGFVRMATGGFYRLPARTSVMGIAADEALKGILRRVEPGAELTRSVSPAIPASGLPSDTALEYAAADAIPHGLLRQARIRPAWFPTADGFRIIWVTDVALGDRIREFRVFVDGETGEPLYAEMLSNTTHESIRVYPENPDATPLSVEDIADADKPVSGGALVGAFTTVLNDQMAEINDGNYLHTTDPNDPTVDLNFDEQNVFYLNNLIRQFFVDLNGGPDLGGEINLDTNPMTSVVHLVDGAETNVENAFFSPSTDRTLFGHGSFHTGAFFGSRDFALEDSVVLHEYSHRINNNIAGFGGAVYGGAMNEGVADYWAATIADEKYIGEYLNPDPEVGDDSGWLGFYGFFRSMDNDRTLSNLCDNIFLTNGCEVHSDGEIYAGLLWDLRQALIAARGKAQGVSIANDLVLEHVFNMSTGPPVDTDDFIEGRAALLTADATLFAGVHECLIWQVFADREIGNGASLGSPPGELPTPSTALPAQCIGTATVEFSRPFYTCAAPDSAILTVTDAGGGAVGNIDVSTDSGDSETFALSWSGGVGTTAAFDVQVGAFTKNNGIIEVAAENEAIQAAYTDDSPVQISFASSTVDCTPDLQFVSSRVFNGSCDADDPFLDGGEAALLEVRLRLDTGVTLSGQPLDVILTLVSNNGNVTVSAPGTIIPVATANGTAIDVIATWAVEVASGVSAGETVDFDVLVSGPGITGPQSAISFTEVLEQDLNFVAQSATFDFSSGEQGFFTAANGAGGTEAWLHQTHNCASPPDAGYWHMGGTNCGTYSILDDTLHFSPFLRIQDFDAKYPSRLTSLRFQHRLDFNNSARGRVLIQTDQWDLDESLAFLPVIYQEAENTVGFVQEDIDLIADLPSALVGTHGWFQFLWWVNADGNELGGPVNRDGWYVDNVEIHWEEPIPVADTNAPASCAAAAVLDFDSHSALDGSGGGSGNSDGVVDPFETIGLVVALTNSGNQAGQSIVGHLSSDRPDIITITDDTATFPLIIPLDTETSVGPHFEFTVSGSAACATVVNFTVVLDHNGSAAASTVNFPVRIGSLVPTAAAFFADDFETDSGKWTVDPDEEDTATTGVWERAVSTGNWWDDTSSENPTQPVLDFDPGAPTGRVYLTENGGAPWTEHDVDGGKTTLQSDTYDLSLLLEPTVSYARWVFSTFGDPPDAFVFEISNNDGGSWTIAEEVAEDHGAALNIITNQWIQKTWLISDLLPVTEQMKFRFIAQDQVGQIIEAQVDAFEIRGSEAVCDIPIIPGEVSPPGAATPLTLQSPLPGLVLLAWEATPDADTYRVVTGNLADLNTFGGVTVSSAAPLECGISDTIRGYVAAPGSVFYLVQGVGVDGVGTAGSGTTISRSPNLTCP